MASLVVERGYSSRHRGAGGGKGHCSTSSTPCPSRVCYCGVMSTPNPLLSKSSSGLSTGLILALLPLREVAGTGCWASIPTQGFGAIQ